MTFFNIILCGSLTLFTQSLCIAYCIAYPFNLAPNSPSSPSPLSFEKHRVAFESLSSECSESTSTSHKGSSKDLKAKNPKAKDPKAQKKNKSVESSKRVESLSSVGVRVHITLNPKKPEPSKRDLEWFQKHWLEANRLFIPIGVCFKIVEVIQHSSTDWHMKTRAQRTRLGRGKGRLQRGMIDLFIVGKLADVDRLGEYIRGVHWRAPKDRKNRRWIIISRIARPLVLAHELGHYFSLPHSKALSSIMNKTRRAHPPMSKRGFTIKEYAQMKRAWRSMLKRGHLKTAPLSNKNKQYNK